ncbi:MULTISPECIES: winged helix-turn-helix domain-containing protein [unclassified Streptomyces]|uniref:winged helix-turn-helix domain-containing protein n=1 Tax=unclassified Streptomyces TaxID=2593676 RepID=UPI00278BE065|nr:MULTISPECIES: winged helix-turn-helix domain-containing protein [unclassified Streptomyces]
MADRADVTLNGNGGLSAQEIADRLRERIRAGELRPGAPLPPRATLAEEFGVERGTVGLALRLLESDGLLSKRSKEEPRGTGLPDAAREEPQRTMVGLAPRMVEAFHASHVRLDAVCMTCETLMLSLSDPLRLIHEGHIRPDSIDVRILLPSRDIDLAFPASARGDSGEAAIHDRWLATRNAQGQVLRHNLRALVTSHGIDVTVTFRALPFTPPVRLYLLNESEALLSYYMVTRREEEFDDDTMLEMFSVAGTQALLFSFEERAGHRDRTFVRESQNWFDALWETITSDLTLSS